MLASSTLGILLLATIIGLQGAFFTIAVPAQLRDGGASLIEIGLIWIVWLPSAFKWLWAPWFEKMAVPAAIRTKAITILALLLALSFLPVAMLTEQAAAGPIVALAAWCALLALMLQLLYAGWAIRTLDEKNRARVNGYAAAGMVLGGIFGGGILPWSATLLDWWPVILLTSIAMAISGLSGKLLRDGPQIRVAQQVTFLHGARVLGDRSLIISLLLIAAASGADVLLPARLVDTGMSPVQSGLLLGSLAMALIVPASLASGWLIARFGLKRCFLVCAILKGLVLLTLALMPMMAQLEVSLLSISDFILAGVFTVLTWQLYMQRALPEAPVSSYAALTSLDAVIRFTAALAAGMLAELSSYATLFVLTAFLTLAAGISVCFTRFVPTITPHETQA
ncbi:major facilitator superfamily MFS_1 [Methylophaga frappieri]|uniref:Major facilitator superfamily MFS_1 n=1 Tax=Methylophaga frappieri (strain ATCC BAA-2434 / DSM 25690 / JAM7) TaxID=754477 RepID=I1YJ82_METFJ|nr:MFS transporter [Methylophaga frappieri]AFJ02975.1 major facilitator superfamily MFS_1 [Methylophaga frappieri]